jgi:polyphosphate kinase 2 (PPK2 family)
MPDFTFTLLGTPTLSPYLSHLAISRSPMTAVCRRDRLVDRPWYNRAGVERVMGYCTPKQHAKFIRQMPLFEQMLTNDGIRLTKLWFSVSATEQRTRFPIRQIDPVRQWKLSPTDLASLEKWDDYTNAKKDMSAWTDTEVAP